MWIPYINNKQVTKRGEDLYICKKKQVELEIIEKYKEQSKMAQMTTPRKYRNTNSNHRNTKGINSNHK